MRQSQVGTATRPSITSSSLEIGGEMRSLRAVAPRRRRTFAKKDEMIPIFEDAPSTTDTNRQGAPPKCNTIHEASHAQRPKPQTQIRSTNENTSTSGRSRLSLAHNARVEEMTRGEKTVLKKEPRRRTIWVPSDDTTVLTIHPGNHNDDQTTTSLLGPTKSIRDNTTTNIYGSQARRAGRRSSLAQAPRRGIPLQPTLKPLQEADVPVDHYGASTGKENVPPGHMEIVGTKKTSASQLLLKRRASMLPPLAAKSVYTVLPDQKKRSLNSPGERPTSRMPRQPPNVGLRRLSTRPIPKELKIPSASVREEAPIKPCRPRMSTSVVQKYPLIYENIEQPRMFEDSWLSNQETAIVELINRIFSGNSTCSSVSGSGPLRRKLLKIYQDRSMLLLYQRLQASLQFGALSLPKDRESSAGAGRYVNDVGLRRQFLRLWMKTYNEKALRAAIEVVVGRQVVADEDRTCHSSELQEFVMDCLLRNEDANVPSQQNDPKSPAWNWRRTMQRGLMLINLLDAAKTNKLIGGSLFKTSSTFKSSGAILTEFTSIMLPWGADITRALGHLDYQLHHVQYPLEEFDYTITNLAVDLRDGVRLTRLVELLLYSDDGLSQDNEDQTISMPTGEILDTSRSTNTFGTLSQHLKYPCTIRVSRAYNNQIALSALLSVRSIAEVAAKTTANDIIDGHRENTLALLWALVGKWGLNSLLDWNDVRAEIIRIAPTTVSETLLQKDLTAPSSRTQNNLLKDWANAIATKHGLCAHNLTTAFADGAIFERIVDEYLPYLNPIVSATGLASAGLEAKLKQLGCSGAFASIFGHTASHGKLFDQEFTLATLAFLCSRLLGPSKGVRERRAVLKKVAEDCATVVNTRERIMNAAVVLQRAWRAHFAWRLERYERGDVDIWSV